MTNLWSDLLPIIGTNVIIVNIITQVLKGIFGKANAKIVCFVTSIVTSIGFMVCTEGINVKSIFSGITCGFLTTYLAMYGYDNLYSELQKFLGGTKHESN